MEWCARWRIGRECGPGWRWRRSFSPAAYARLPEGELGWFVFDQGRDAYTARAIASGQSLPLLGPEVQGGPAHTWGPLYFYVLAIPFAFSSDPAVALVFVSAIGLASVFLTYRLGRAFFSLEVGLIAAALFATYPLPVIESRAISNVGLLPFFTVLFFHSLLSLVVHQRSAMIVPVLLCVGALVQIHLAAISSSPFWRWRSPASDHGFV